MFGKRTQVGLDLGAHALKCAVAAPDGREPQRLWSGELYPERTSRADSLNQPAFRSRLEALLKACQKELQPFGPSVITAVQGEGTASRYLELPALSKEELGVAVPAAAGKLLAFPMEKTALSYFQIPPLSAAEKKVGVFVVAARKDVVEENRLLLESCGLEVERIETPVVALVREFARSRPEKDNRFCALVHVGFRLTQVVVLRSTFPYFAIEFSTGGRDFTYAFQLRDQRSWKEAEASKRGYDVMTKAPGIEPFVLDWVDGIKRALDFFQTRTLKGEKGIEQVYLSGGSASWTHLDRRLSEHLGLPIQHNGASTQHAVAVGLALGG